MASNELTVSVSVEASIHKALHDFAQHIFDEHGVQLFSARVDWLEVSSTGWNKAWTVVYDGSSEYPRLVCTACATDGGTFGWVSKE